MNDQKLTCQATHLGNEPKKLSSGVIFDRNDNEEVGKVDNDKIDQEDMPRSEILMDLPFWADIICPTNHQLADSINHHMSSPYLTQSLNGKTLTNLTHPPDQLAYPASYLDHEHDIAYEERELTSETHLEMDDIGMGMVGWSGWTGLNVKVETFESLETEQPLDTLDRFLKLAPIHFSAVPTRLHLLRLPLPDHPPLSCIYHQTHCLITGTDIIRTISYLLSSHGYKVINQKKLEQGIFSDLRNLKVGEGSILEESKSELLKILFRLGCVRTAKKQKLFGWSEVDFTAMVKGAITRLNRDEKKEETCGVKKVGNGKKRTSKVIRDRDMDGLDEREQAKKKTSRDNNLSDIIPITNSKKHFEEHHVHYHPIAPFPGPTQSQALVYTTIHPNLNTHFHQKVDTRSKGEPSPHLMSLSTPLLDFSPDLMNPNTMIFPIMEYELEADEYRQYSRNLFQNNSSDYSSVLEGKSQTLPYIVTDPFKYSTITIPEYPTFSNQSSTLVPYQLEDLSMLTESYSSYQPINPEHPFSCSPTQQQTFSSTYQPSLTASALYQANSLELVDYKWPALDTMDQPKLGLDNLILNTGVVVQSPLSYNFDFGSNFLNLNSLVASYSSNPTTKSTLPEPNFQSISSPHIKASDIETEIPWLGLGIEP